MQRFRYWILVLFLLTGFLATGFWILRARFEAGVGMPEYSVFSDDHNGYKTAAGVLHQLGFQPVSFSRPIQNTRHRGLLIVVKPQHFSLMTGFRSGLSDKDKDGLLRWVQQGNTLVLCTDEPTPVHEELGIQVDRNNSNDATIQLADAYEVGGYTEPAGGPTLRVEYLGIENRTALRGRSGVPLWTKQNNAGAWIVTHGKGRVLFIADAAIWTHRGLLRHDNVLFLYNIAAMDSVDGQVYFDEYHHGIRSGGGYWEYLRYHHLHWIVLQLLLIVAIGMWTAAVRLGPAVQIPKKTRADAVDYASAVARIYQRAGMLKQMRQHISRDFLAALTRLLRLRKNTSIAEIMQTWQKRFGKRSSRELARLVDVAQEMRAEESVRRFSKRDLLYWAREFDQFLKFEN